MNKQSKAPFNSLEEIAFRKEQLRRQISRQEEVLAHDFDAYQEDVDTLKQIWSKVVGIRNLRKSKVVSGLSNVTKLTEKPGVSTAISLGTMLVKWLWNKRRKH